MIRKVISPRLHTLGIMSCLVAIFCVFAVCSGADTQSDKRQSMQGKARMDLRIANEQFSRGLYRDAEVTLLGIAEKYSEYLVDSDKKQFQQLSTKVQQAVAAREQIAARLLESDKLVKQGQYAQAMVMLEGIEGSKYLRKTERDQVLVSIRGLEERLKTYSRQVQMLFDKSVRLYDLGQYDPAKIGFAEVVKADTPVSSKAGKTAQDYLGMIARARQASAGQTTKATNAGDELLGKDKSAGPKPEEVEVKPVDQPKVEKPEPVQQQPQPAKPEEVEVKPVVQPEEKAVPAGDVEAEQPTSPPADAYINEVQRQRKLQVEYTRAVVLHAVSKARTYLEGKDFTKAKQSLAGAFSIVNRNRLLLGDELYKGHLSDLEMLDRMIEESQRSWIELQRAAQDAQAADMARQTRLRMERQRYQAIIDYMDRAFKFQEDQRYEEALGQLEQLLGIDPTNRNALILKRTLEDTITWKKQIEIQQESRKEEIQLLLEANRKGIPYAKEINFDKNWKQIAKSREEQVKDKRSPADAAVYAQLDEKVDMSALTEETSLGAAIEMLRSAVDPPLTITVLWSHLTNAFIEQETPIGMSGQGLTSVSLKTALERILQAASPDEYTELGYVVEDGIITVATTDSLPTTYKSKIYDIAELVSPPSTGYGGGGGLGGGGGYGGGGGGITQIQSQIRAYQLVYLIQETIEPDSWYDADLGGEGTIREFGSNLLIVRQTPGIHEQIADLIEQMLALMGQQVAIDVRFLLVDENYLEDVGLDVSIMPLSGRHWGLGDGIDLGSYEATVPTATGISGSLAGASVLGFGLSYGSGVGLDDLQVSFMIRATEMHANSKTLTAPKLLVMSGESATISVTTETTYKSDSEYVSEAVDSSSIGAVRVFSYWDPEFSTISEGINLNITPTITADKKYVLLNISTSLNNVDLSKTVPIYSIDPDIGGVEFDSVQVPVNQTSSINTRVQIPDRGTILLGGLTMTAEKEIEAGVPFFSKIPILGRLFSNRSEVKDKRILLILVKPTIILKDETERAAMAEME